MHRWLVLVSLVLYPDATKITGSRSA